MLKSEQAYFLLMRKSKWDELADRNKGQLIELDVSEGTGPKDRHRLALIHAPTGTPVSIEEQVVPADEDEPEADAL